MDWTLTDIKTTIDFDAEGKQAGELHLTYSDNIQPLGHHPIPVAVIKNGKGPTLLVTGGTHGDEFEGPAVLFHLMHTLNETSLTGRVIIFPALNTAALLHQSRCSPLDNGNLNRAFPGDRRGSPTSMIAHLIENVILPECDGAIDFHSGGKACVFVPLTIAYLGAKTADNKSLKFAMSFAAPYLWSGKFGGNTFNAAAIRNDVPMFATELGGGGGVDPDMVELAKDGLLRVMSELSLLNTNIEVPISANISIQIDVDDDGKIHATREGLFVPDVTPGQSVGSRDYIGTLYSIVKTEREPLSMYSNHEGVVLSVANHGVVKRGDLLMLIGKEKKAH